MFVKRKLVTIEAWSTKIEQRSHQSTKCASAKCQCSISIPPKKHQKNSGFPMFLGGIEREYWC